MIYDATISSSVTLYFDATRMSNTLPSTSQEGEKLGNYVILGINKEFAKLQQHLPHHESTAYIRPCLSVFIVINHIKGSEPAEPSQQAP